MSNGKTLVDPYTTAIAFATEHFLDRPAGYEKSWTLRWRRSEWYEYDAGCYRWPPEDELKAKLVGYLHAEGGSVLPQFVNAVALSLHHVCLVPGETTLDSWLKDVNGADVIVAANGNVSFSDIDAETGKRRLLPHTPLYFTMSKLPYDYDPGAKCPSWDGFKVKEVVAVKAALTTEQVARFKLPPQMTAKKTSINYKKFADRHGNDVFELEALRPQDLQKVLREAIETVVDRDTLNRDIAAEKTDATQLAAKRKVILKTLGGLAEGAD